MEEPAEEVVVDGLAAMRVGGAPVEIMTKKRRTSDFQVTAFQAAIAMPDLLDPQQSGSSDPSTSDPSTSDPNTSDDTSPSSFLGTPYSTSLQFDYPFPISNAPRDPTLPLAPLPSVLSIASSLGSAPSIVNAAVASEGDSENVPPNLALPSLVSSIAASPDLPVNNNLSDLRSLSNMSTSSLNSTHSGHTAPGMVPVTSSAASVHSISPSSSFQTNLHMPANSMGSRHRARHSLTISPMPPPPLSIQTSMGKQIQSPPSARRPKAQTVSSLGSTDSDMSHESNSLPTAQSRPTSGSVSSLSITSLQLLTGPGEPPIPPSLLNKLGRPRNVSTTSNTSSYFTTNVNLYKGHNSREFFGSPVGEAPGFTSVPNSPPQTLGTDSSVDVSKPLFSPPAKSAFSSFRPSLGRSNSTNAPNNPTFNRPFFGRSNTTANVVPVPNPVLQSRAYAQHLRHQQQQQLKLQEEQRKKAEKKEKKEKKKQSRSSLSLTRSLSSSSSSSAKTRASSTNSKSPPSTSTSQLDGFKLSPSQRSVVENAVSESEESTSPEGSKKTKVRRRSSVRRALEKTGSLVGFNLSLNASKRGGHH